MKVNRTYFVVIISICSIILIFSLTSRDRKVLKQQISNSCSLKVMAFNEWEISIPFYLLVDFPDTTIESGCFYYCAPEDFEANKFGFDTGILDNLAYIYDVNDPKHILALIDCKSELVYPPNGIKTEEYYALAQECLDKLKALTKNEDLRLIH